MRLLLSFLALLPVAAIGQQDAELWPGADYDPSVPTIESVVGHAPGERVTWHRDVLRYFEVLAAAQGARVSIHPYATSWEGRELFYVVLTSEDNMARIDEIQQSMQRLRNAGNLNRDEAARIIDRLPAVTWLTYGVHGDEISSTDAAMLTAYHLLAARGDDRVEEILQESVVVIDPMQNPDGRDRFIHSFEIAEGLRPDPFRYAAEHDQPWPSGRYNHYLFDMNRDWFAMTQPETRGRIAAIQEWYPVVVIDLHEMGGDRTYFFAPGSEPVNPHLTATQMQHQELVGRTNAAWFDHFGIEYFTRDVYDDFYPGYGSAWPTYFGATAITYEQAGVEGLTYRQYDGSELSYADAVRNHFVTSLATAETVATNRARLLQDFYEYQLSAIDEGRSGEIQSYIIPRQSDQAGANKLAGQLVRQGVEVGVAQAGFKACGKDYATGSYVIDMAQPAKRLVRTLLDPDVPMKEDFVQLQEERRARGLGAQMYDVTAWSVPLMMNVDADSCSRLPSVSTTAAGPELVQSAVLPKTQAEVSYLVPWGQATSIRFLSHALLEGLAVKSSDEAFTLQGREFPGGTLIIDVGRNDATIHEEVRRIAQATGAELVAVDDSWVTAGPSLGGNQVVRHNPPDVAIAWDVPVSPSSAGHTRFVIERQFDYPVTAIRTHRLAEIDLADFEVLILPASYRGYAAVLGEDGADKLRDWVEKGGVLIGLGTANEFLADPNVDLISIRRENAVNEHEDEGEEEEEAAGDEELPATVDGRYLEDPEDLRAAIHPETALPDSLAGALLRAEADPDHWLAAGVSPALNVLAWSTGIYTPIRLDAGTNVVRFAGPENVVASGHVWDENRRQLAYKPFVALQPTGRGYVIAFTQDPNIRAYQDGLNTIFMNAVFRAPAHARPLH